MPVPSVTVNRNVQPASPDVYSQAPEVVRYDRYLLVSTEPQAVQRDPLSQVIDIRIPSSLKPTVVDAMRYALKQSGYTLCATGPVKRRAVPSASAGGAVSARTTETAYCPAVNGGAGMATGSG